MRDFLLKENIVHPDNTEILKYIWHELDEEKEIAIGEHLATCETCINAAQNEAEFQYLWEKWQAHEHGDIYWENYIARNITRISIETQSVLLKERLLKWLNQWKGKVGSILQVIDKGAKDVVEIITNFPDGIFAPAGTFSFIPAAPVRGTSTAPQLVKIETKEHIQVQYFDDETDRKILVRIPKDCGDPPLIILAPRKGMPVMAAPEEVPGTAYYTAVFTNIPASGWVLLFEPLQRD